MLTICLSALIFTTTTSAQQKFTVSVNGVQEVPVRALGGRGSCVVTLNIAETEFSVLCNYSGVTTPVVAAHIHDAGLVGVNGPVRFNFAYTGGTSGTIGPLTFAVTPAQVADLRAKRWYVNIHTQNFTGGEIRGQVKLATTPSDFDGDGRTDISVFRQSANTIFTLDSLTNSISATRFGSGTGDNFLQSTGNDFDGDGRSDPLLIKINQTSGDSSWSILQTGTNSIRNVQWGNFLTANVERLAHADYDGDGKQDIAIFRSGTTAYWYILQSSNNTARIVQNFGAVGDSPSIGDFDADGKADLTVVRSENGQRIWYTQFSSTGQSIRVPWGAAATDLFFFFSQVDIDGDGKQDRLVFRDPSAATGEAVTYYILRSSDNQPFVLQWGLDTDARLFGDYDGDGKTDIVARRTIGGQYVWYIYQSSTQSGRAVTFGGTGDTGFAASEENPNEYEAISAF